MGNKCIARMACQKVSSNDSHPRSQVEPDPDEELHEVAPEVAPEVKPEVKPEVQIEGKANASPKPSSVEGAVKVLKKALLIGINYTGQSGELRGCINDVDNLQVMLLKHNYFNKDQMTIMTDHQKGNLYPSKANIMQHLKDIAKLAKDNHDKEVQLFISYSGHGSYQADRSRDEDDGRDEMLCPIDYAKNGFIVDDDLKRYFVDQLGANVKCIMIIDACHSGTIVDLKYNYAIDKLNTCKPITKIGDSACDIVMISGCTDTQTSADAYIRDDEQKRNESQGAMTKSLLSSYKEGISYYDMITGMRKWLKSNRFTQIPQVSSGKSINTKDAYMLNSFKQ